MNYQFKTPPRQIQAEDLERAWGMPAWGRFWEMRVGKGVGTAYEMDAYAQAGMASRFLVVCPKRVISTWQAMISEHSWTDWRVITKGSEATLTDDTRPVIWLTNYERAWERVTDNHGRSHVVARRELVDWCPEFVVADEAHKIKNRMASRSRGMCLLGSLAKYRRALTGTPDPTAYSDYFGIFRFLDPNIFGTWKFFADEFLMLDWWRRVIGYRNVEKLATIIRQHSSRMTRAQCFEVPEAEDIVQPIDLPETVTHVYDKLSDQMFAELEAGAIVSAPIILTKLLRLAQVTSGYARRDDGQVHWLHYAKIDALMEVLDEILADAGAKAVVYFRFLPEMDRVAQTLEQHRIGYLRLDGSTRDDGAVQRGFRDNQQVRVLLCQAASGSLGIDLSAASTAIFFSWDYDAGTYQHARDRIWKLGGKISVIHLAVPKSIDTTMLRVVAGKIDRSTLLLDHWQKMVRGEV